MKSQPAPKLFKPLWLRDLIETQNQKITLIHDCYQNNTFYLFFSWNYSSFRNRLTYRRGTMLVTYVVILITGILGSAIAWNDLKQSAKREAKES
jgi:hypothetical protein